ncbi:MAG: hypothetical protein Q4D20_06235 [Clostridia bacterium]|nr:hypothetical protein [Clostridia bacterium]
MKDELLIYALNGFSRAFFEGLCANVFLPFFYLFIVIFREVKKI